MESLSGSPTGGGNSVWTPLLMVRNINAMLKPMVFLVWRKVIVDFRLLQKMQIVCILRQTAHAIKLSPLSSMFRLNVTGTNCLNLESDIVLEKRLASQ